MNEFDKLRDKFQKTSKLAVSAEGAEGNAASRQARKLCANIIRHPDFGEISFDSQLFYIRWYVNLAEDKFQQLENADGETPA